MSLVNFTCGFGVSGHSTGGRAVIQSAVVAQTHHIRAGVGINPDPKVDSARNVSYCPIAVFTGTGDNIEPKGSALADFNALPPPKVFADMTGETHITPVSPWPKWGVYTAAWFHIHINQDRGEYFDLIYGNAADSLCSGGFAMESCILHP